MRAQSSPSLRRRAATAAGAVALAIPLALGTVAVADSSPSAASSYPLTACVAPARVPAGSSVVPRRVASAASCAATSRAVGGASTAPAAPGTPGTPVARRPDAQVTDAAAPGSTDLVVLAVSVFAALIVLGGGLVYLLIGRRIRPF